MLDLISALDDKRKLNVLCVGAHCDDIEIGCGATLLRLQRRANIEIQWVVLAGDPQRQDETTAAMKKIVKPAARRPIVFGGFPDGRLPACYAELKDFFDDLKRLPRPDVIFCHERDDRHQDHRVINEMVWTTFRDQLILEYEIVKWDGGITQPNVYVPISEGHLRRKIAALMSSYPTQAGKDWFTPETFLGLARVRGVECRSASGYAEAFHGRKISILKL